MNVNIFQLCRSLIFLFFFYTVKVHSAAWLFSSLGICSKDWLDIVSIFTFYLKIIGRLGEKSFYFSYTVDILYNCPVDIGEMFLSSAESSLNLLGLPFPAVFSMCCCILCFNTI